MRRRQWRRLHGPEAVAALAVLGLDALARFGSRELASLAGIQRAGASTLPGAWRAGAGPRLARRGCERLPVPEELREGGPESEPLSSSHGFASLAAIFPEWPELPRTFDEDAAFREDLLEALDDDVGAELTGVWGGSWRRWTLDMGLPDVFAGPYDYEAIEEVLTDGGIHGLSGREFISRIGRLCGAGAAGGDGGAEAERGEFFQAKYTVPHIWHRDSGFGRLVCLGFPAEDGFEGEGVFSHVIPLSHRAVNSERDEDPNYWAEYVARETGATSPAAHIMRPRYRRGREILVFDDAEHVHATPDQLRRKGIWIFSAHGLWHEDE